MSTTNTLAQVLNLVLRKRLSDVHTAMPARVEKYDAEKQVADLAPLLQARVELENGTFEDAQLPVLPNVPVVFPAGGGFRLTFPLAAGDTVLVVFAEGALDRWQKLGGVQPTDGRRFHLADAICIPGLHHDGAAWTGAAEGTTLGKDGSTQLVVKDGELRLGTQASHPLLLADTYQADEGALLDAVTQQLSKTAAELGIAATSLTAAATANAVPIIGGALAAAPFGVVVTQLGMIASDLAQVVAAIAQFKAKGTTHLSQLSKTE